MAQPAASPSIFSSTPDACGSAAIRWSLRRRSVQAGRLARAQKAPLPPGRRGRELRQRAEDYFSPSNSLLHEVMRRRLGVPLTLGIVMMELGWRVGIPFEGVGFPGHFLVRLPGEPSDLVLDPYKRGMTVHEEDCRHMLLEATGGKLEFDEEQLASVGKRAMITRLLNNLKGAYLRAGEHELALAAVDRLLVLSPDDVDEMRDRGLLLFRLDRYGQALECMQAYLEAAPDAPDHATIERHIVALRQLIASLN